MNRPIRRGMYSLEIGIGRMKKRPEVRDRPIFGGWGARVKVLWQLNRSLELIRRE